MQVIVIASRNYVGQTKCVNYLIIFVIQSRLVEIIILKLIKMHYIVFKNSTQLIII